MFGSGLGNFASRAGVQAQTYTYFLTAGTLTAYTLTPTPAVTAYTEGTKWSIRFHVASGAAPTLAVSGVAAPPNLVKQNGDGTFSNIAAGDIPLNHVTDVVLLSATQALVTDLPSVSGALTGAGTSWTARTSAADNGWRAVAYGNGLFVAVAQDGANRVMTSPDGITWTSRSAATADLWSGVVFGNGLFVAVEASNSNRVMTSPDGITWTSRDPAAAANDWRAVTYGQGLFVAVSADGAGNRVMTSPNGIDWTSRVSAADNTWTAVCYANGLFVAVAASGAANRVMTSPDGITWTGRVAASLNNWQAVTYGNGLYVAVGENVVAGSSVMTSPDGITWTSRVAAVENLWRAIAYGNGLFAAVSSTGTGDRVMTSPDGVTWTTRGSAADNTWRGIAYANGIFVAVATSGVGNRVMTSGQQNFDQSAVDNVFQGGRTLRGNLIVDGTNTATVDAVTINKLSGRVNIAAAGTSVVVTNNLVTAASHVFAVMSNADATGRVTSVVPAAGSFTINTVAVTAQASFDFLVINAS